METNNTLDPRVAQLDMAIDRLSDDILQCATWGPEARAEIPSLREEQADLQDQRAAIVAELIKTS